MDRKRTTQFLTNLLISKYLSDGKYYAKEVSIDFGTAIVKRIDVVQFVPQGVVYTSDIEKGHFVCYEIKSCVEDIYSGNGLNFLGEENYIVTTMTTYKALWSDLLNDSLRAFVKEHHPESSTMFGVMVPVPATIDLRDQKALFSEFEHPTVLNENISEWKLYKIQHCQPDKRKRSMTEMLFYMLRAKHNYTNDVDIRPQLKS